MVFELIGLNMNLNKTISIVFLISSISTYATNCGRGIMERNFDRIWSTNDPNLNRAFFSPMNRDIRRLNALRKLIAELNKRSRNEELSNDPKRA